MKIFKFHFLRKYLAVFKIRTCSLIHIHRPTKGSYLGPTKKSFIFLLHPLLTRECCINEGVSQSYVGKSVVSLLSIPTMGEGQDSTLSTTLQPKVTVGKI